MRGLLIRVWICLLILGVTLYAFVERQNHLRKIQVEIPKLKKEYAALKENNGKLQYELQKSLDPKRLQELLQKAPYGHLKFPSKNEILYIEKRRESP